MRRTLHLIASLFAITLLAVPLSQPASAQASVAPHAWLFGTWTGGLFPPPSALNAQECLAQPVAIFTRDLVMRVVITDQFYTQRLIETARATGTGVEFRFAPSAQAASSSPFGQLGSQDSGFSCENPDVLHVRRRGDNEISFPGCPEFPYPLVRCPAR